MAKTTFTKAGTWVVLHDLHYPKTDWPTFDAMLDFVDRNEIVGFIFGGDQFDNEEISHHTKGKPLFRERAAYKKNTDGFRSKVLDVVEDSVGEAERIWIVGNHDRFEADLIEEQPQLEGVIERPAALNLSERGWQVVPLGHAFRLGKLSVIHGEVLTGIGNQAGMYPSRKAVDLYAGSVLAGHTHSPQSFTRISPVEDTNKWMGWIAPAACNTNPSYLRNRPTAWLNGFTIVEVASDGNFNLYPIIVAKGRFCYGGETYGA